MANRRLALLLMMMAVTTMQVEAVAGKQMGMVGAKGTNANQTEAAQFLETYNREKQKILHHTMEVHWELWTNITTETQNRDVEASMELSNWNDNVTYLANQFNVSRFPAAMKRQFFFIQTNGTGTFSESSQKKRLGIMGDMKSIYSTAKVCLEDEDRCLSLDPDITSILQTSRDEALLRRVWTGWRDASGKKMRDMYAQYVTLSNEASRATGYADRGAEWRSLYETESFEQDVAALFEELRPFYQQLHAFARRRLKKQYGEDVFPSSGHIPAHLLGNMWAQKWDLQDLLMPFPDKPTLDITEEMLRQNYTARKIFETADAFFTSLRLEPMSQEFWDKSMLEKPSDGREVVCHASASNFHNGKDVRIKQCTEVTTSHFITAHHEMGHAEYYLLYNHLPIDLRQGANPGFHEAVGDTIGLSVQTPKHLHNIGLLPSFDKSHEADLNFLMTMALQKVAFLPFGYLIDQWRWSVFRGDTSPQNYNQAWWHLRCKLQGVSPPVKRTEEDFDPGAKYHIADDTPYIRYFVSYVIQFQFHKALCEAAGHQGPLHTCDIYNSMQAGDKLRAMLSKGRSEVWTEPFKALTGQSRMSVQPLVEYFQPLMDYLQHVNSEEEVGWSDACP